MYLTFLLVFVIITLLFHIFVRYSRKGQLLSKIPGNRNWPIIGDALDLILINTESMFSLMRKRKNEFDRIYKFQALWFGAVNIYHPEDVEIIYSNPEYIQKEVPYVLLKPWLGEGLLTSNGDKWKQRRKCLNTAFNFNILKRSCVTFNENAQRLIKCLEKEVTKDHVDILPFILDVTLKITCEAALGISVNDERDKKMKKYFESFHEYAEVVASRYMTVPYHFDFIYKFTSLARKEKRLIKYMHNFTEDAIRERKQYRENNDVAEFHNDEEVFYGKKRLALLDLLLEVEKEGNINLKEIREEIDTFVLGGHDTTALAISFMLMRIAHEPEIQEKIYEEMMQIFDDSERLPTINDLNNMKYLECCIKESLRLYPPIPLVSRYTTAEVKLGGYTIPRNVIVHVHIYDTHRDPKLYPDPEKFDPDRFLPEQTAKRHPYAYLAFSAGPRNCIGQKFGMLVMKCMMSLLLRRFIVEPVTRPEDVRLTCGLTLKSIDPVFVRIKPRNSVDSHNNQNYSCGS